jgi:hypothetical protein
MVPWTYDDFKGYLENIHLHHTSLVPRFSTESISCIHTHGGNMKTETAKMFFLIYSNSNLNRLDFGFERKIEIQYHIERNELRISEIDTYRSAPTTISFPVRGHFEMERPDVCFGIFLNIPRIENSDFNSDYLRLREKALLNLKEQEMNKSPQWRHIPRDVRKSIMKSVPNLTHPVAENPFQVDEVADE